MNLRLGSKIGAGFGALIVIALLLGGMAVFNMYQVRGQSEILDKAYVSEVHLASTLERRVQRTRFEIRGYVLSENKKFLKQGLEGLSQVKESLGAAKKLVTRFPFLAKLRESLPKIEPMVVTYENLINKLEGFDGKMDAARVRMDEGAARYIGNCQTYLKGQFGKTMANIQAGAPPAKLLERIKKITIIDDVIKMGEDARVMNFKAQALRNHKGMLKALEIFPKVEKRLAELVPITTKTEDLQRIEQIRQAAASYEQAIKTFLANWDALERTRQQMSQLGQQILEESHKISGAAMQAMQKIARGTVSSLSLATWIMVVGLAVALVLGIIIAWFITRGITRPVVATGNALQAAAAGDFTFKLEDDHLNRGDEIGEMLRDVQKMADNLSGTVREATLAAETVASSSSEISQGNQDLSNRTQQQASAIEETASAIEQMTSSVKQNANNSQQANQLAKKTAEMAREGGEVVQNTVHAMEAVTESSKKIADIINVVNEIAFQTNLLALNAAVEAARAGEAGRGFAVVAGEVRNLAGRSASAAKEIQGLITDSVSKVEQGNEMVSESGRILGEIIENVQNVADTMGEINAASQEQAQGIEEVNKAVTQMDEAVQQNAALVEEAASASENMASAAEELRSQMAQFKVEGGPSGGRRTLPPPQPKASKAPKAAKPTATAAPAKPAAKKAEPKKLEQKPASQSKGDDFFDGVDLEGFEEF